MNDQTKTKKQLIEELAALRKRTGAYNKEHSFSSSVIINACEGICGSNNIPDYLYVNDITEWKAGEIAIRALKAGATGYLSKKSISEELIKAVHEITSGRRYITSSLADKLASYIAYDKEIPIHKILSDREYKVMCMIIEGKTRKAIAEELSLSVNTISTYRARILDKLKMKTTAQLTQYAMNNHLTD
jgi:DNA-binding NarL/FixJ family response regulator